LGELDGAGGTKADARPSTDLELGDSSVNAWSDGGYAADMTDDGASAPSVELCDGLDNDGDGIVDNGLVGCDSCTPHHHELPLVTHYSAAIDGYAFAASDAIDLAAPYPTGSYTAGRCYYAYRGDRLPDFDKYIGDRFAIERHADADVIALFRAACKDTAIPFKLLKPDAFTSRAQGSGRLRSRSGLVQVLHAKQIDGSLITVFLPPNWSSQDPPGRYPIVFNGFYDINQNVMTLEGPPMSRMIAMSASQGRSGAIGVLWNGGGAVGSRTINRGAFAQFEKIVRWVEKNLGGDRHRIFAYGGSRGGLTTAAMASNPYGYDYTVRFAAVAATPTQLGEHAQLQGTTYPGLLHAVGWSTGLADAWRQGWVYPACAQKPHLEGLSGPEAHLFVLTGTTDFTHADNMLSPISSRFISGLLTAGTQLYLSVTGHDDIIPYAHQMEYAKALIAAGVPVEVDVLLRAGHADRYQIGPLGELPVKVNRVIAAVLPEISATPAYRVTTQINFFAVNRQSEQLEPIIPANGHHPFTVEYPYRTYRGERFAVVFYGEPGTEYSLVFTDQNQVGVWSGAGTLSSTGKRIEWIDIPSTFPVGRYFQRLSIRKPGATSWQTIPSTNTPTGRGSEIIVEAAPANIGYGQAVGYYHAPTLSSFPATNWGLSEL
jgi:acetyl esterase/lipase